MNKGHSEPGADRRHQMDDKAPSRKRQRVEASFDPDNIARVIPEHTTSSTCSGHQSPPHAKNIDGGSSVHSNVQLVERLRRTLQPLTAVESRKVEYDALRTLGNFDPFLRHICKIKLVRNERKNFINVRIRKEYVPTIFHLRTQSGLLFLFSISVFVEPFVNITPVDPQIGVIRYWRDLPKEDLFHAVSMFKTKFGISRESYRYSNSGMMSNSLESAVELAAQSTDEFVLFLRIATTMFTKLMPILQIVSEEKVRQINKITESTPSHLAWGEIIEVDDFFRHIIQRCQSSYPEFRLNFVSTVYSAWKNGLLYEFHLSDKFEPFVIAIVIDPKFGKLVQLRRKHVDDLEVSVSELKQKFGIEKETYHYTPYSERMQTDKFVQKGGASMKSKAHSTDFHLKIRVSSSMYLHQLPIFGSFDFNEIRKNVEPIMYNFGRETVDWESIKQILYDEADSNS